MKYITILFLLLSTVCFAQTAEYDIISVISVYDSLSMNIDTLYTEKGKFQFKSNEILKISASANDSTKYFIMNQEYQNGRIFYTVTNIEHEFIIISSDGFIGGSINVAILKEDKTLIYSYTIKCLNDN